MRGWPCKKRGVGHHFRAQEKGWANRKCALHWGWAMSKYALLIIQNHTWKMQTRELFHLIVCLFVCLHRYFHKMTDCQTKLSVVTQVIPRICPSPESIEKSKRKEQKMCISL